MGKQAKEGGVEMRQYQNRKGGFLKTAGAFALGAGIGSVVALLFAPASGIVTRRRIAYKLQNLKRSTVKQLKQTRRVLIAKADDAREAAVEQLGHARQWITTRMTNGHGKQNRRHTVRHA